MTPHRLTMLIALLAGAWVGCSDASVSEPDDGGTSTPTDADTSERLPCPVETVLRSRCQGCHTSPPQNGAPFPLRTYADTQADYFGKPVFERMRVAIETDFMPPDPRPKLEGTERSAVLDWINAGALPAAPGEACP